MLDMIDQKTLLSLVSYDPETGEFIWLPREQVTWQIKVWNTKHAGKKAGSVNNRGYLCIKLGKRTYKAHRVAWLYVFGKFPESEIDHINRNKLDNRIVNLRVATRSQNVLNTSLKKTNKSGLRGISWYKRGNKWQVQISVGGRSADKIVLHIGYFHDIEQAKKAYNEAHVRYRGEECEAA
jgi:HNH endonuclease/AP2 domain